MSKRADAQSVFLTMELDGLAPMFYTLPGASFIFSQRSAHHFFTV